MSELVPSLLQHLACHDLFLSILFSVPYHVLIRTTMQGSEPGPSASILDRIHQLIYLSIHISLSISYPSIYISSSWPHLKQQTIISSKRSPSSTTSKASSSLHLIEEPTMGRNNWIILCCGTLTFVHCIVRGSHHHEGFYHHRSGSCTSIII